MDLKTAMPTFNVALRGYDRDEVEEYLDSLASSLAHADDAAEHIHRLQLQVSKMGGRIRELEDRIAADIPKTGAILGERIAIMLRQAEETATEAITRAEGDARHIESEARARASEITTAAEARASARTRQIEDWAQDVIAHARDEEARVLAEIARLRERSEESLGALEAERDDAAAKLSELRSALGRALDLVQPTGSLPQPKLAPAPASAAVATAAAAAMVTSGQAPSGPFDIDTATVAGDAHDEGAPASSSASSATTADSSTDSSSGTTDDERADAGLNGRSADGHGSATGSPADASAAGDGTNGHALSVGGHGQGAVFDPDALTEDDATFEARFEAWVSDTGSIEVVDVDRLERG